MTRLTQYEHLPSGQKVQGNDTSNHHLIAFKKYIDEGKPPQISGDAVSPSVDNQYMDKFFNQHKIPIPDLDIEQADPEIAALIQKEKMR